jgi:hypothetical protein
MILFSCPECGFALEFGDEAAGTLVRCPECRATVTVPTLGVVPPAPAESAGVFGGIDPLPHSPGPAEFGVAPLAGLPAPLGDPLRALRQFLGWLMLVQVAFVVGWLVYSYTLRPPMAKVGTAELAIQGIILALPFILAFWRLLPNRVVNAYYLRSFRHDAATAAVRRSLTVALGRRFRLSGIRDPRRRSIKLLRYLTVFLFALRYATAKYLNLEAGADWKQRLWRSLGDARCAVLDVSDLTPFVVQEIRLCFRCLGLNRMLFVCKPTSFRDAEALKGEIGRILNRPSDGSEIQLAIWDSSRAGRRAFEADVRRFADRLPAEPAGLRHDAYPLRGSPAAIDDAPGAWDGWVWLELGLGLAVAVGLGILFRGLLRVIAPSTTWALIFIPLLGLALCEFWQFLVYLKDCGSLRERCLTLLTFGFAWIWFAAGTFGEAVEKVQLVIDRIRSMENLKQIGFAMLGYESQTFFMPLVDGDASEPILDQSMRFDLPPEKRIS